MVTFRIYPDPKAAPGAEAGPRPHPSERSFKIESRGPGSTANVVAALASFFLPGLGQLIQGRLMSAAFLCLATTVGYFLWFLILPAVFAFLLHVVAVLDAALYRPDQEPLFDARFSA